MKNVRKRAICLALVLASVVCAAQSPWQLGFQIQPLTSAPDAASLRGWHAPVPEMGNYFGFGYKAGVVGFCELNRFLWLQSGLLFSRRNFNSYPISAARDTARMTTRLTDLQVPLALQFRHARRRWGFVATPAVFTGLRFQAVNTFDRDFDRTPITANNRSFLWPAFFGLGCTTGIYYQTANKMSFMLEAGGEYEFASQIASGSGLRVPANYAYLFKLTFVQDLRR